MMSISSKLRPFVSGINSENVPIPKMLIVANIRNSLYPRSDTSVGVTLERTKLKSHCEALAVARP